MDPIQCRIERDVGQLHSRQKTVKHFSQRLGCHGSLMNIE